MSATNGGGVRSTGEMVRLALCTDLARLVAHDAAARTVESTVGVHQARVAARRLRSHLETFEPVLRGATPRALGKDLRALGRALGSVRDLDVLRGRLADDVKTLDPLAREDGMGLLDAVDDERERAARGLVKVLVSKKYRAFIATLSGTAVDPPFRRSAGLPAEHFLCEAIHDRYQALADAIAALPSTPSDVELHEVRILAKPVRYSAELGSDVLGPACSRLAKRVTDLCDTLGSLNDGAKADEWLHGACAEPWRAFAVGRVRAAEVARMAEDRAAWARCYEKVQAAAVEMGWARDALELDAS
jgi:CHAD domain-containing protein